MNTTTVARDYHCSISFNGTAKEAFDRIGQVTGWWAKNLEGQSQHAGDVFTVRFGTTWVTFRISEVIPNSTIVWKVTDCFIPKLNDKREWNGTTIVWEISSDGKSTNIKMTHVGLVPEVECYEMCEDGWNRHIKNSLFKLITEQKGNPS
jgi:hypothetical protein